MLSVTSELVAPATMKAVVYRGKGRLAIESVPVPRIGPGELLVRVESCGICPTDLKKIEHDLLLPPRIFGHESAGVIVATGEGVRQFAVGVWLVAFRPIP